MAKKKKATPGKQKSRDYQYFDMWHKEPRKLLEEIDGMKSILTTYAEELANEGDYRMAMALAVTSSLATIVYILALKQLPLESELSDEEIRDTITRVEQLAS